MNVIDDHFMTSLREALTAFGEIRLAHTFVIDA
jgi:hypothetical protein